MSRWMRPMCPAGHVVGSADCDACGGTVRGLASLMQSAPSLDEGGLPVWNDGASEKRHIDEVDEDAYEPFVRLPRYVVAAALIGAFAVGAWLLTPYLLAARWDALFSPGGGALALMLLGAGVAMMRMGRAR